MLAGASQAVTGKLRGDAFHKKMAYWDKECLLLPESAVDVQIGGS